MTGPWVVGQGEGMAFEGKLESIFYGSLSWKKDFSLFLFHEYMQRERLEESAR